MRYEIRVAGFGGQGVITAGFVLANAVSIHDGKQALMTQSYGPEARGGACKTDIIVSDVTIDYPKTSKVDCLVAMSIDAYARFINEVKETGIVIYEKDLVTPTDEQLNHVRHIGIRATEAAKQLGNPLVTNMVMLGAVQKITGRFSIESLKNSVKDRFPRYVDLNLEAVRKGAKLAAAELKS